MSEQHDSVPAGAGMTADQKKKKNRYATQAFEIGTGANAQANAQGYGFPGQASVQQPHALGMGMGPGMMAPGMMAPGMTGPAMVSGQASGFAPGMGMGEMGGAPAYPYAQPPPAGGYEDFSSSMAHPPADGVGGITAGMGGMHLGGVAQPMPHQARMALNQLHTSDLAQQPFHAAEIDMPPPPLMVPPNSSATNSPHANCSPRYVRSTLNAIPTTHALLKKSKLPFALIIQPYGSLHDHDDPIPLVQDQVISRCRRCRSYINPFVVFMDQGHKWRCNFCGLTNDVPQAFDWDAASQQHTDRWQRPELNNAVVEFLAPQEYMVRPPQPLVYLFLLDVSWASVSSGLLATAARTIADSLDLIPNADQRTRIGFIAFDSNLHYFSIPQDSDEEGQTGQARMLVVGDLEDAFLPVPHDLLVPMAECTNNLRKFLASLPQMFQDNHNNHSCLGSALRAGHKLISPLGGKITVLTASIPTIGHAKLEVREDKKLLGTSKEGVLLQTANSFYKSFAVECSKSQVSIDMFLCSSKYQDVASLSNLPRFTGGQTWYYPSWNAGRADDAWKLGKELSNYLSSEIGLEAVLRVRATTGLRMNTFYGNFFNRSSDLCAFPAFPRDQVYVVEVAIDENLNQNLVCMQTAVLHTTCNGERRIRVMTVAVPTTTNLADVYASADQVAITTFYTHKAVEKALGGGLDAAREMLAAKLAELLVTFKKELGGGGMVGGLQFPYNLRALPALFLGLIKHVGLRKSSQIPSDIRSAALCLLSTLPAPLLMQYIYPKLYSLHDMSDSAGVPDPQSGMVLLPPPSNLISERFVPYGLYLLDDGQNQFLWLGRDAVPQLVMDVFGVEDRLQVAVGKGAVPELDNDFNERVRAIILKSGDARYKGVGSITVPSLYIVKEDGEPQLRLWAQSLLVEDRAEQMPSYQQWMGSLREKIC